MTEPGLDRKVLLLHEALSDAGIPHAMGGALALGFYGEPRMTVDVDVNVFVAADRLGEVAGALSPLGVDIAVDAEQVSQDGQCRLHWGRNPIDLFFSYDPFHEAMRKRTRTVPFGEGSIEILAPEHLMVCKAAFDRPKDWIDIEQMLIGVDELDRDELFDWLERVTGEGSEQVGRVEDAWSRYR